MDSELIIKSVFSIELAFMLAFVFAIIISYMIRNCRRSLKSNYILAKYYEKEKIEINKVV